MEARTMRAWIALIFVARALMAAIWNVPQDAPTIQAAFDSLGDGDTVLVAAGVYHESLQAPDHSFVLLGVVNSGGDPERPVVDPSPLEGSTHLACLTLPYHQNVVIRQIIFRNGPEMYPREHPGDVGGIGNNATELIVQHCTFDSTYKGLACPSTTLGTLAVSNCSFTNNVLVCLEEYGPGRTTVSNSSFSGTGGDRLAWFTDSATVQYCTFTRPDGGNWIKLVGAGITVRGCNFNTNVNQAHSVVLMENARGCTLENNTFQDLHVTGAVVLFYGAGGDTTRILHNSFKRCYGVFGSGGGPGIDLQGFHVLIADNVFETCVADQYNTFRCVKAWQSDVVLRGNRFSESISDVPSVRLDQCTGATLQDGFFMDTGNGLYVQSSGTLNAEHNWWGDATGPFHAELNPTGLGDTIVGSVDFDPWLTDSVLGAPAPFAPLPLTTQLEVFPNPFNATATLNLIVNEPGIFRVDLYNLLGQHMQEVWSGAVAYEQRIALRADELPSGLYFVRVYQPIGNRVVALQKVVLMK